MTVPRGLKAFLKESSPGKLTKGAYKGYRAIDSHGAFEGPTLKGITKRLAAKLYSAGELDDTATTSTERVPGVWKGNNGGLRRGKAVDSQVSRLASASESARNAASKYKFTSITFSALSKAGLTPLLGQRVALSRQHGIATAADMLCWHDASKSVVVVELKCGFSGNRTAPAAIKNRPQKMKAPCAGASDCLLHRHMAQLATTYELLRKEARLLATLKTKFGVAELKGALLYSCDRDSQLHELSDWWVRRGRALVALLGTPD